MTYRCSFEPHEQDTDWIYHSITASYWSPGIRGEVVETAFDNSIVVCAFGEDGGQVAVARVITDKATFAWICDVFVDPAHRGRGIGKALIQRLLAHPDLQTLRAWGLGTKDAHGLYAQFGFGPAPADRWMVCRTEPSTWQAGPDDAPNVL